MTSEINRIIGAIEGIYNGNPWFGNNLESSLQEIDAKRAAIVPEKLNHSIAEILKHMIAWRLFVIEKLKGNAEYEVWETDLDWVKITELTEETWQKMLTEFLANQKLLIETIVKKAEQLLDNKVDGRSYNFRLLLNGIIQHDIYHIGQISILRKLI
jgi:uncharacterized damage-inducible protein DinB